MQIEQIPIEQLKHAEYNPRSISKTDFEQLKRSIQEFGFVEPLVVNRAPGREGVIVGGNQRFEAAKALGHVQVPVFFVTIPDLKKEQELNVRLNRNVGEWDFDTLANQFDVQDLLDWGFKDFELDLDTKKEVEEVETPPVPETPRAGRGKLYLLGRHRLLCGDSTDSKDYELLMGGGAGKFGFHGSAL